MRRFSDFLGLHEKLTEKYAKRGRIIPPAPEKSLVSFDPPPLQGGSIEALNLPGFYISE
jgi:sorting nexin-1/2